MAYELDYLKKIAVEMPMDWEGRKKYLNQIEDYVKTKMSSSKVTSTQVRNLFNAVQSKGKIEDLILLKTDLMYTYGKSGTAPDFKNVIKELLIPVIEKVDNNSKLETFKSFIKAILCFHKYYENTKYKFNNNNNNSNHDFNSKNSDNRRNSSQNRSSYRR